MRAGNLHEWKGVERAARPFEKGRMEEWRDGKMEEWKGVERVRFIGRSTARPFEKGRMEEWRDGKMEGYGSRITHHASRITFHAIRCSFGDSGQSTIHNRIRSRQTEYGHTLIELMIALSVSLIALIGGLTLYRSGYKTLNVGRTSTEIQQGARKALETMIQELQETATGTIDTSVPYAISFASARGASGFASNNDGTPAWQNAVVYFLDTGSATLCRYVEAKTDWSTGFNTASAFSVANPEQLVPHVTNLQFQLVGNLLRITIAMSENVESAAISDQLTTQVYVRN